MMVWFHIMRRVNTYEAANGEQAVGQPVEAFAGNPRGYSIVVYNKGGLFLDALRRKIGTADFDAGLHNHYEENAFGIARPKPCLTASKPPAAAAWTSSMLNGG